MRDFELEKYFSKWEFTAKHHMTASDLESMDLKTLLAMASEQERDSFNQLWLGYTQTWGDPVLRSEIASTFEHLNQEQIICLAGAAEGIYAVSRALLEKRDHLICVVPNYQSSETIPLDVCQVSGVILRHEDNWQLDVDAVKAALRPNTKMISINFPNNPTGAVLPKETLMALVELCRSRGILLFSDEVYRGVEVNPKDTMPQVADIYEKGISLNVMSKAYGLPGLRIGWLGCQDRELLVKVERYKHYLSICNSAPSEQLALIALRNRDAILARNRGIIATNLLQLNRFFAAYPMLFDWQPSKGGCVAYPKYIGSDGVEAFCRGLVEQSGVLLLPSSIYHSELLAAPAGHFRIGFGRQQIFADGLQAMRDHIDTQYHAEIA